MIPVRWEAITNTARPGQRGVIWRIWDCGYHPPTAKIIHGLLLCVPAACWHTHAHTRTLYFRYRVQQTQKMLLRQTSVSTNNAHLIWYTIIKYSSTGKQFQAAIFTACCIIPYIPYARKYSRNGTILLKFRKFQVKNAAIPNKNPKANKFRSSAEQPAAAEHAHRTEQDRNVWKKRKVQIENLIFQRLHSYTCGPWFRWRCY